MNRGSLSLLALLLAAAPWFADHALPLLAAEAPIHVQQPQQPVCADTTTLVPRGAADVTAEIRRALRAPRACALYFPPGTYTVSDSIHVPSNRQLLGDSGRSVIRQTVPFRSVFHLQAREGVRNVRVNGLAFEAAALTTEFNEIPCEQAYAVCMVGATDVRVTRLVAEGMGIAALYFGPRTARIAISHNQGVGHAAATIFSGIHINRSWDVTVEHNDLRHYAHPIMWWGGDARVEYGHATGNLRIRNNHVRSGWEAIFGSNGTDIWVEGNDVAYCSDVCLDAEGSRNVTFRGNTARFATVAVLASYYRSENLLFEGNYVEQDGRHWGSVDELDGRRLFHLVRSPEAPVGGVSVTLRGNRFRFTGEGLGYLTKMQSSLLRIEGNTFEDVVVAMAYESPAGHGSGRVEVVNNGFSFSRSTGGEPAVYVGRNHERRGAAGRASGLEITGNQIRTACREEAPAILVEQTNTVPVVTSVAGNTLTNFGENAVRVLGSGASHRTRVRGNVRF